jgi:integrase
MHIFKQILKNEYKSEYDLRKLKQFSDPKIYDGKGDLSKRWDVYFSYRDPLTQKLKRQPPIYGEANKLKTKTERMEYLTTVKVVLKEMLKKGYNPYEDARETDKRLAEENRKREELQLSKIAIESKKQYTVEEALQFAYDQRSPRWAEKSLPSMKGHYETFLQWLKDKKLSSNNINELKKREVSAFLNTLKKKQTKKQKEAGIEPEVVSPKTRNNYRATIASLFSQLENDEIIPSNFVEKIIKLKENPKKNKPFTEDQLKTIREYLDENNPYLRTFIQFISYGFLRNIEVCRLKVGDVDLNDRKIYVRTKTETQSIKPIIDKLYSILDKMNLKEYSKDDFLLTRYNKPSKWNIKETSKTDYFSDQFLKVKEALNLSDEYSIYSFRHTVAINIYHSFIAEGKSQEQAIYDMMPITGHTSKAGLKNYLRGIGALVAKDYSNRYTIDF